MAMSFGSGAMELSENIRAHGSIILSENIFSTSYIVDNFGQIFWFIIPLMILVYSIKENSVFLKISYLLASISLGLTTSIIRAIGFESLYIIKLMLFLTVTGLLTRYLITTLEQLKKIGK